ncbi:MULTISPECIES: hypothetical protein [unclassified Microbacterium]|jgi:hypothetical protein|uniref:hypothetical protein n=1 Tax=unclassified Microbacterium TaxID=2609290 RepID=UPI001CBC8787|nr:hypothetical protein [Microbacterium sp. OVT16B]
MNRTVRSVATLLAVGFAMYFAARGVWWIEQPSAPLLMVAAIAVYLVVVNIAILWGSATTVRMPLWAGVSAAVSSFLIPSLATHSLDAAYRTAPFATWYIGGIGLLGVVCIVRRRFLIGWITLLGLVVVSSIHLGLLVSLSLGLVGSIMWVVVARLLVLFWDRAIRDTERLADIQQAVSAWHATQQVRQRERRLRTQFALAVAGPVLSRTVAAHGDLTEEERLEARLAEGRLRDELRGADLLNDAVRDAIADARRRGVAVTVFDEGGLDEIGEERRAEIRDELARVLADAHADRVIVRAARDERVAVTVVGRASAGSSSDDDSVDLWHEIPRDPAAR